MLGINGVFIFQSISVKVGCNLSPMQFANYEDRQLGACTIHSNRPPLSTSYSQ